MDTQSEQHQQDIFEGLTELNEPASVGMRFLNYLVDYLFMHFVLTWVTNILLEKILNMINPAWLYDLFGSQDTLDIIIASYLIAILNYTFYYTFSEKLFNGKTLGKLVTGTRAIRTDGEPLTWKDAVLRSLCRLIPFEAFSAFGGNPWHDSMTNTMVVKSKK